MFEEMSKHRHNVIKLYPLEYLANEELTEEDLFYMFDTPSLCYSLIYGMFGFMNIKLFNCSSPENKLRDYVKQNKWHDKHSWSIPERNNYIKIVKQIYKNVYTYSEERALIESQMWVSVYGFLVK